MPFFEIVGYLGTFLIAASFVSKSIVRLRILNATGALLVTSYALVIKAYPIAVLDGTIFAINAFQLMRLYRRRT